uniref:Uncharacterized protein n=1 Tax=Anguilla anguilla TaxID=7936 RepID=A0A0E9QQ76_ANGAN
MIHSLFFLLLFLIAGFHLFNLLLSLFIIRSD